MRLPNRLNGDSPVAVTVNQIIDYLRSLTPQSSATVRITHTPHGVYHEAALPQFSKAVGGYMGEYDQTKSYSAGQTFKISAPLTITIGATAYVIVAGLYGVRPAASVDSQTFGPFAGSLPANPSSAGIDMDKFFFNPQLGLPSFSAAPNDKLYADLIIAFC
jgi:hypothetical protein